MNFTAALPALLLGALALVMFGLGLSLSLGDFVRLRQHPKAVLLDTPLDMAWVAVLWPPFVILVLTILFYFKRWLVRRGYVVIVDPPVVGIDMEVL